MAQYDKYTLFGTAFGEVFSVESESFFTPSEEEKDPVIDQSDKFSTGSFKYAKCYNCADSPITKMQVVGNKLFVSSKNCSSIIEFQLKIEENSVLLDQRSAYKN